jgi:hypothetical protein
LQHYGKEIVAKELGLSEDHPNVELVFLAVYRSFMEVLLCIFGSPTVESVGALIT